MTRAIKVHAISDYYRKKKNGKRDYYGRLHAKLGKGTELKPPVLNLETSQIKKEVEN